MESMPYPTFRNNAPVDKENKRAALSAVGKCRLFPASCSPSHQEAFLAITEKTIEQGRVDTTTFTDDEEKSRKKSLKKKLMKEGVAMAKSYLMESLGLDVSVVDVEVVLRASDILASDGCLAACFLDAGCQAIVVDGTNLEAMDVAKIPRKRLVAHFSSVNEDADESSVKDNIAAASALASSVSIETESIDVDLMEKFGGWKPNNETEMVMQIGGLDARGETAEVLAKASKANKVRITLVDPTATQMGLCFAGFMRTDRPDGLYTTVVCTRSNEALGLVYSAKASIIAALECGRGVYWSRSRGGLWRKGDTSGHYQILHRLDVDCDGDALRFTVTQLGDDVAAFCHLNTLSCWGPTRGLRELELTLQERLRSAPEGSYTKRLFEDPTLLRNKLVEEAQELSEATGKQHVAEELADVLYFAMVRAAQAGVTIDDAAAELDRRARKVTRRKGDSKAFRIEAGDAILSQTAVIATNKDDKK